MRLIGVVPYLRHTNIDLCITFASAAKATASSWLDGSRGRMAP